MDARSARAKRISTAVVLLVALAVVGLILGTAALGESNRADRPSGSQHPTTSTSTTTTTEPGSGTRVFATRDPRTWPFATNSPWNMPRGAGATFDPRPVVPGPLGISAANGFGVSVGGAGYPLLDQAPGENHYSIVRPDGVTADEYFRYGLAGQNHVVTDLRGSGVGVGYDVATQLSQLGGVIRLHDIEQGVIPHALQMGCSPLVLSPDVAWPALSGDSFKNRNVGFVPYGALLAIPSDAPMPQGMSDVGHMIWTALRDYGAYCADAQGEAGSPTQTLTSLRAEAAAEQAVTPARDDLARVGAELRWVTNNTADRGATNLGGPGPRLAPYAPRLP
jgi:hypothetical protein